MAQASLAAVVAALWAELGLPAPAPGRDGFTLTVDGQAVRLAATPDGRSVLISAVLGPLSKDRLRASDQLRLILEEGAGLVLSRAAATALRPGPRDGDPAAVVVEAVAPCDLRGLPRLQAAIEDVLFLADVHRPTLSGPRSASAFTTSAPAGDEMIFRL